MGTVPQEATRVQYLADGIADVFIYPFFIPLDVDITVWVTPAGSPPNETVDRKILNTNYTVQDAGVPGGGTITFLPGFIPGSGDQVTLSRTVEDSITTNYVDARTINGANLDESFEREMLVTQQNVTNLDQTALRYQNNAFLPDVLNRNIIPTLDPNFIWKGSASGNVVAVEDVEENGCSSLRSELASEVQGSDGAGLVGYFDENRLISTTVRDQLNEYGDPASGQDGARIIGYYDPINAVETNVGDQLDLVTGETDGLPEKLQNNFAVYGDDVGVADALEVNVTPAYQSYVAGTKVFVKVAFTNLTTTPTLNLNGLGVQSCLKNDGSNILPSELKSGGIYEFIYDGVNFQLITTTDSNSISFSQVAALTINNGVAFQSLLSTAVGSKVIPANFLREGSYYNFIFSGSRELFGINFSSKIRILSNGTLLAEFDADHTLGLLEFNYEISFIVRQTGSPSNLFIELKQMYFLGNGTQKDVIRTFIINNSDFDSTVNNTIDIQANVFSDAGTPFLTTQSCGVVNVY